MRHAEYSTVPSDADIRKPSSPAGLHGSLILEVLGDSHCLQVIADIERPVYSPVMRDSDFLPRRIIESRRGCRCIRLAQMESPAFLQKGFSALGKSIAA